MPATIGFDEVGRGCIAGPLVVAGVRLVEHIDGLADSKQLSVNNRTKLERIVRFKAEDIAIAWVDPDYIDSEGLGSALRLAFNACFSSISKEASDRIVVDGSVNYLHDASDSKSEAVIQGDTTIPAVMAASIIAKQARDRYMMAISHQFPAYAFEQHVGYGTAHHYKIIKELGLTSIHRQSIKSLKPYVSESWQSS